MAAGRPRSFDLERALAAALEVFLAKGYEGASLVDLTSAMGINPPSLYAAFGNKEGLFRQVLERYEEERDAVLEGALVAPTAPLVVEAFLRGNVINQTRHERSHGCLLVQGALACGDQARPVREQLTRARLAGHLRLTERLMRAQAAGEIPPALDPEALARYVGALVQGFAVQAASGVSRTKLLAAVNAAVAVWPVVSGASAETKAGDNVDGTSGNPSAGLATVGDQREG